MKTQLVALAIFVAALSMRGDVVSQWNFNSTPPDASASTGSTNASVGSGSLFVVGGATYTFAGGNTAVDPAPSADNSAINVSAFPTASVSNKTAGIRFAVDTSAYHITNISWSQRCSATASRYYRLQYSADGVNFVDATNVFVVIYPNSSTLFFTNFTADVSSLPGIHDNQNFAFQIVSEFENTAVGAGASSYVAAATGSTYGTAGTARFEMMTVSGTATGTPNHTPGITVITNVTMRANSTYPAIPFTIGDQETAPGSLILGKTSSDTALLPATGIVLGGSGSNRTVTLTPAVNQSGQATVTLTVIDEGGKSNSTVFAVNVIPTNTLPVVSAILSQGTVVDMPTAAIPFTIGDLDTAAGALTVTAVSGNTTLLPNSGIALGGSDSNRTVTLTPAAGQVGHVPVTITVSDGVLSTNRTFVLSIEPSAGVLLTEQFNYPNGPLITNSSFLWQNTSGNTGELQVIGGLTFVTSDNSEDVSARLRGEPYTPASGVNLYYSLRFSAYDLPTSLGDYFIHLKDNGSNFRAKLMVSTTNAPLGFYRIGVANGASFPTNAGYAEVQTDFTFDQTNLIVVRYNVGTGVSTLWVNPVNEASPSVTASDLIGSTNNITQIAIRESRFQGNIYADDLRVATSFDEALGKIPEVVPLRIRRSGGSIEIAWPATAAGYTLETRAAFGTGSWQTAPETPVTVGNENVVAITSPIGTAFYRLKK